MDPNVRSAILIAGLLFVMLFGAMTLYVLANDGLTVLVFFVTLIEIPAVILLGIWFVLQFLPAIGQTAISDLAGGDSVAYLAHVGGFVFGLAAIRLFVNRVRGRVPGPPAAAG